MLSKKKRQEYLKYLGFYTGEIDGKIGPLTKAAYKALQDKYFTREEDKDGFYGPDTDMLLVNAYNVKTLCKNFRLEEFKCKCGGAHCTGYPAIINTQLLVNVQSVRDRFGSTDITSGLRCKKHNSKVGGSTNSRHKSGKALDIKNSTSKTLSGRRKIMDYWKTLPNWRYTYCNENGNYPNMGNAVHIDVK